MKYLGVDKNDVFTFKHGHSDYMDYVNDMVFAIDFDGKNGMRCSKATLD